jgi:hypothetical protein
VTLKHCWLSTGSRKSARLKTVPEPLQQCRLCPPGASVRSCVDHMGFDALLFERETSLRSRARRPMASGCKQVTALSVSSDAVYAPSPGNLTHPRSRWALERRDSVWQCERLRGADSPRRPVSQEPFLAMGMFVLTPGALHRPIRRRHLALGAHDPHLQRLHVP